MTIPPFGWKDGPSGGTPLDSVNLEAMLAAAGAYADGLVAAVPTVAPSRTQVSSNYQALATDTVIAVTNAASVITITLADPTTLEPGQQVIVKDETGNDAEFQISVNGLIDGQSTVPITTNYGLVWVYCTGSAYASLASIPIPGPVTPPVVSG